VNQAFTDSVEQFQRRRVEPVHILDHHQQGNFYTYRFEQVTNGYKLTSLEVPLGRTGILIVRRKGQECGQGRYRGRDFKTESTHLGIEFFKSQLDTVIILDSQRSL